MSILTPDEWIELLQKVNTKILIYGRTQTYGLSRRNTGFLGSVKLSNAELGNRLEITGSEIFIELVA